jgi:hypothetical protein
MVLRESQIVGTSGTHRQAQPSYQIWGSITSGTFLLITLTSVDPWPWLSAMNS